MLQEMTVLETVTIISPCGLAALLREARPTTLVVDCRGFTEFNESHISHSTNAFFSKLIRRRLFENKLDDNCLVHQLMNSGSREEMEKKLDVILYAEEDKPRGNKRRIASCNAPESSAKILRVLRERLEETEKFRSVMVLEGGYKHFATQYPQLCESSEGMTRLPQSLSQPCLSNPNGDGITLITPNVYLGSQMDSLDAQMLKALDITVVINLSVSCPKSVCIQDEKNFMRIPVNDSYQEKLLPYFAVAFEFLERCRVAGKKCLIHCLAGISRSPTLCISYIMKYMKKNSDDAYRYVKERRPSISPNFNFMGQLLEYEHQLIDENILRVDQASRPNRLDHHLPPFLSSDSDLCPPKVPKSASSHCVFSPLFTSSSSVQKTSDSESDEPSNQLNANGKRGMTLELPLRPRALGLPMKTQSPLLRQELPSPSSEFSRMSFDGQDDSTSFANPCFLPPMTPTREISVPLGSSMENPLYFPKSNDVSKFKRFSPQKPSEESISTSTSSSSSSRPECLRSSTVLINTPTFPPTTEEEEAESPESGFIEAEEEVEVEDEDRIHGNNSDDTVSISSASSLEITCK